MRMLLSTGSDDPVIHFQQTVPAFLYFLFSGPY